MHTETDLRGRSGKTGLFKWSRGPFKTTDNTGILNGESNRGLPPFDQRLGVFRLPQSHRPAAVKPMRVCSE